MRSVRKTITGLIVLATLATSMCACSNESNVNESITENPDQTTSIPEQNTVQTDTVSSENLDNSSLNDFKYTLMTKSNYDKYGEDAIGKVIILKYTGESDKVTVPSTCDGVEVIAIGANAFEGTDVTEVELPNSIQIIEDYAFSKCTKLVDVNEISNLDVLGRCVFEETQWLKDKRAATVVEATTEDTTTTDEETGNIIEKAKGIVVYSGWLIDGSTCSGDIDLSTESEIKAIAKDAFRLNLNINTVNLTGSNIKFIDDYAFSGSSLALINLPVSLERFGESVFSKCNTLKNIDLSETNITELSKNLFSDSLIEAVELPKIATDSTEDTSGGDGIENSTESDTTEDVGEPIETSTGITLIGYGAFNNCIKLEHIELGTELRIIEDYAFAGTGIESIELPDTLEILGLRAFSNCSKLQSVTFGRMLSSIGDEAFVKCEKLLEVTVPKNVQSVGKNAFGYTYTTNEKDLKKIDDIQINCLKGSAIEKYCMNSDIKYNIIAST